MLNACMCKCASEIDEKGRHFPRKQTTDRNLRAQKERSKWNPVQAKRPKTEREKKTKCRPSNQFEHHLTDIDSRCQTLESGLYLKCIGFTGSSFFFFLFSRLRHKVVIKQESWWHPTSLTTTATGQVVNQSKCGRVRTKNSISLVFRGYRFHLRSIGSDRVSWNAFFSSFWVTENDSINFPSYWNPLRPKLFYKNNKMLNELHPVESSDGRSDPLPSSCQSADHQNRRKRYQPFDFTFVSVSKTVYL